ncbi:hypothetical protein TSTA_005980 [Talaromyces stipitatus ATCC 10500]|uniref:Uncharacterized protein n=1 Tax=Talaromyces stipitatus (strain ATCC 10500 / CBS 375.48 / QM 6759 / NRRL 1006) TaxID=441959 RepID=B8MTT3_TALSN|nr:uncharacterized protein TSTA_005980 [Talaromyces stipitatus ATCC 10500]EED12568.1 hypothetical protein TSTA_005980 [Talaromyces stipitatus ATCC 10500]
MLSNIATKYKLNSPEDWDDWQNELLNRARANDLLPILQGTERPIKKPVRPKIQDYLPESQNTTQNRVGAAQGTRQNSAQSTQTTATEDITDDRTEQRARNDFNLLSGRFSVETSTKSLNG